MHSPYKDLPAKAYWRSGVGTRAPLDPGDVYVPKFPITKNMRIGTAGSCFAQHVGRALRAGGFRVIDNEKLDEGFSDDIAVRFGYRLFSARYGNVYTVRQLAQTMDEANGNFAPALPVWEKDGRFFDAMRPNVEPGGLDTAEQVLEHRAAHLGRVKKLFKNIDLFIFTFGLTEAWIHRQTGTVYPTAPGTIAGEYDPDVFAFKNYTYDEIYADFVAVRKQLMKHRPDLKFLVTVSPVPLTATASGQHVEVASSYSKSVLRAVTGALYDSFDNVDYFPSYEIITSQNARGIYYEDNKRSVSTAGVATAMSTFMGCHQSGGEDMARRPASRLGLARVKTKKNDVVCEEAPLEAFAK